MRCLRTVSRLLTRRTRTYQIISAILKYTETVLDNVQTLISFHRLIIPTKEESPKLKTALCLKGEIHTCLTHEMSTEDDQRSYTMVKRTVRHRNRSSGTNYIVCLCCNGSQDDISKLADHIHTNSEGIPAQNCKTVGRKESCRNQKNNESERHASRSTTIKMDGPRSATSRPLSRSSTLRGQSKQCAWKSYNPIEEENHVRGQPEDTRLSWYPSIIYRYNYSFYHYQASTVTNHPSDLGNIKQWQYCPMLLAINSIFQFDQPLALLFQASNIDSKSRAFLHFQWQSGASTSQFHKTALHNAMKSKRKTNSQTKHMLQAPDTRRSHKQIFSKKEVSSQVILAIFRNW